MFRFLPLILVSLLSACTPPTKTISTPPDGLRWQQHAQQVSAIKQWNLSGRMAIETEDNGGQFDIFWQQQRDDHYDIRMVAPFGGGTSFLKVRPRLAMFTNGNGEQLLEKNTELLLAKIEGWQFPVSGLRYWILGVPAPDKQARLVGWNEQGYLHLMEQDGWRIELLKYKQAGIYTLPKKIFIRRIDRDDLSVRMVVRSWGFQD